METLRNDSPRGDGGTVKVRAASLQEAYRQVRREFGGDAEILGSRSVGRHRGLGPDRDRSVEVTVRVGGADDVTRRGPEAGTEELMREVDRIEELIETVVRRQAELQSAEAGLRDMPVAATLLDAGASAGTVRHLLTRFRAETDRDPADREAFVAWLGQVLPAGNCGWTDFSGCHAFLGQDGCGRTGLVLEAATRLQQEGRRVLVLAVMPAHGGEIRRLQTAAAAGKFDAAVIQKAERLEAVADQFAGYDAVLIDLPALEEPAMAAGGTLHAWLASNGSFHRHFVLPLDGDARDLADLAPVARSWNCDWSAATRTDASRRWGKLLDLDRSFGLPWSVHRGRDGLEVAASRHLMDRILGAGETTFESGTWLDGEEAE
ncbi:MAG: hypothetical protein GY838_07095 [bacterium]|nr:hypothetical protein [bacterium]